MCNKIIKLIVYKAFNSFVVCFHVRNMYYTYVTPTSGFSDLSLSHSHPSILTIIPIDIKIFKQTNLLIITINVILICKFVIISKKKNIELISKKYEIKVIFRT